MSNLSEFQKKLIKEKEENVQKAILLAKENAERLKLDAVKKVEEDYKKLEEMAKELAELAHETGAIYAPIEKFHKLFEKLGHKYKPKDGEVGYATTQ